MTHIYQPVMIKKMLESGNKATTEDLAREFINWDVSLVKYYEKVVKRWPKITLTNRKIVKYEKNMFTLLLDENITQKQKKHLIDLCDHRRDEYVRQFAQKYGAKNVRDAMPGSIRYEVLHMSGGVCSLCGISATKRQLDVDHILPVNLGGQTIKSNLQVLCRKCNAQKRDRDDRNFLMYRKRLKERDPGCVLCNAKSIKSNSLAIAIHETHPITELHSLVIPKRHEWSFFELMPAEKSHCMEMIDSVKTYIQDEDNSVKGFNVGFDSGVASGQNMMHCHIHVIPRRSGDSHNPEWGIKNHMRYGISGATLQNML